MPRRREGRVRVAVPSLGRESVMDIQDALPICACRDVFYTVRTFAEQVLRKNFCFICTFVHYWAYAHHTWVKDVGREMSFYTIQANFSQYSISKSGLNIFPSLRKRVDRRMEPMCVCTVKMRSL